MNGAGAINPTLARGTAWRDAGTTSWSRQAFLLAALLAVLGGSLLVLKIKLPALACLAAAGGLVILVRPDTATLVMAMLLYTNATVVSSRFHGVPRLAGVAIFVLLLIPAYHQIVLGRKRLVFDRAVPLIALFVLLQTIGTMCAEHPERAVHVAFTSLTEGLILYLLLINVIRDKTVLRQVVWTLLLAGGLLGTLSALQQWTGEFNNTFGGFAQVPKDELAGPLSVRSDSPRSAGPIGEKNYYAQFMLLLLPLGLTFALTRPRPGQRWAAAVASALIALGVAFTASRGAAVGAVVMVVAMVFFKQIRWQHVAALAVAALLIVVASPQLSARLATIADLVSLAQRDSQVQQVDKSTQGRLSEMLAASLVWADHPIQGVGPGNFPAEFLKKADAMGFQVHTEERLAHCAVLEIAAENGLLGLLCIAAIFFVSFQQLVRARRAALDPEVRVLVTAFLVTLIVLVCSSFFLSFAYVRYYWFMLALAAAAARLALVPLPAGRRPIAEVG